MEPLCKETIAQKKPHEKIKIIYFSQLPTEGNVKKALCSLYRSVTLREEEYLLWGAFLIRYHLTKEERCWLACTALFALDYDEFTFVTDEWIEDDSMRSFFHDV